MVHAFHRIAMIKKEREEYDEAIRILEDTLDLGKTIYRRCFHSLHFISAEIYEIQGKKELTLYHLDKIRMELCSQDDDKCPLNFLDHIMWLGDVAELYAKMEKIDDELSIYEIRVKKMAEKYPERPELKEAIDDLEKCQKRKTERQEEDRKRESGNLIPI
jgi:tetratricopeptide (TPR) repeat protein